MRPRVLTTGDDFAMKQLKISRKPAGPSSLLLLGLALFLTFLPAQAPAQDCTGISDVSDYDGANISDFDGDLTMVLVASGLVNPTFVGSAPGDVDRLFILEQVGKIKVLKDGALLATPFLDITSLVRSVGNEEGLLGLAFHPDYATNGWFFVFYTKLTGSHNIVARYTVSANPDLADSGSRVEVIAIAHPTGDDQDGGMLAFNPHDGYLYIGSGSDGNSLCDPMNNAQNKLSNLGKILRLNVDSLPYTTTGNPWDGSPAGNDEIWAYGLKNPWRFAIDPVTGVILIGDVGERHWEEVDCQPAGSTGGENYGYKNYEGDECPAPDPCPGTSSCVISNYVGPIRVWDSFSGIDCSVVSGYVYRGCRMSDLHGTYFYADYCASWIRTFRFDETCNITSGATDLDRTADLAAGEGEFLITSFGQDARGEMYVLYRTGHLFKILPTLGIMQVSARNAEPLHMDASGDWRWEDLEETAGHPLTSHKVYRSSNASGTFTCVYEGAAPVWSGGDPATPSAGGSFYYLVTSLNSTGEETRGGKQSNGRPRTVDYGSTCP